MAAREAALEMPGKQKLSCKVVEGAIQVAEDQEPNKKSGHGETVSTQPIEVAERSTFAHEQHDAGAAVERRDRKKIESAEEQIQREEDKQNAEREVGVAGDGVAMKPTSVGAEVQSEDGEKHEREVGGGAGEGHPRGAPRMAALPERIVRGAGPTHHKASDQEGENGNHDHSPRLAANVRDGIERNLAAKSGGFVATELGDESVRRFVTGGREKKGDVPDKTEGETVG